MVFGKTHGGINGLIAHCNLRSGADFQLILSNDYLADWN